MIRYIGPAFRVHEPRYAADPVSGRGAAIHGGRFNPRGTPALYLSLDVRTALRECRHDFVNLARPGTIVSYKVDVADIVDLRTDAGLSEAGAIASDLGCPWLELALDGKVPPTWRLADDLIRMGVAGVLVRSFAVGAEMGDSNLVLWRFGSAAPYLVEAHDPHGDLPTDQSSWTA